MLLNRLSLISSSLAMHDSYARAVWHHSVEGTSGDNDMPSGPITICAFADELLLDCLHLSLLPRRECGRAGCGGVQTRAEEVWPARLSLSVDRSRPCRPEPLPARLRVGAGGALHGRLRRLGDQCVCRARTEARGRELHGGPRLRRGSDTFS